MKRLLQYDVFAEMKDSIISLKKKILLFVWTITVLGMTGNKNCKTAGWILIFGSVMALMLTVVLSVVIYRQHTGGVAYIIVEPGNNRLCFEDGSVLNGWDSYGCTYFFVPSYMDFTRLSYDNSEGRIYSPDGKLLEHPSIGDIEDVLVETAEGMAEYRVGFFKSENLYTFNLETYDTDIDDVEREECVSVSLNVISPAGVEVYRDQEVLIKGRGNNSWE